MAFQLILDNGGDPTKANNRGTNVLMLTVKRSQMDMAEMCLAKIADEARAKEFVNSKTEAGWTALMTAAENNQVRRGFIKGWVEKCALGCVNSSLRQGVRG